MNKLKQILRFPLDVWLMIITGLPGPAGYRMRYGYWKKRLKFLGKDVTLDVGVYFQNPRYISLDDNCWIDRNVIILAGPPGAERITYEKPVPGFPLGQGDVYIGKCSHIAPNCVLSGMGGLYIGRNTGVASNSTVYTFSHHYRNLNDRKDSYQYSFTPRARLDQQAMILGPVLIEDYCAVGLNCVILPGTSVKKGSWIKSGSVIFGTYPEQSRLSYDQGIKTQSLSNLKIKE